MKTAVLIDLCQAPPESKWRTQWDAPADLKQRVDNIILADQDRYHDIYRYRSRYIQKKGRRPPVVTTPAAKKDVESDDIWDEDDKENSPINGKDGVSEMTKQSEQPKPSLLRKGIQLFCGIGCCIVQQGVVRFVGVGL